MKKYNFNMDRNQRFGFRKYLGIGLCSVMIGSFFIAGGQQVKADTVGENNQNTTVVSSTSDNTNINADASTQDIEKPAPPASSVQDDTESNEQGTTVDATEAKTDRTTDEAQQAPAATENNGTDVNAQEETESEQPAPVENKQETETASEPTETPETPQADKSVETPKAAPTAKKEETTTFDIKNAEKSIDPKQLGESKVQVATRDNGGYDESTWGTLDITKWSGAENTDGLYELTGYTGDLNHIIIPNEADFAKAGQTVSQVAISRDLTHSWFDNGGPKTIAISKTSGKTVKALGDNWEYGFSKNYFAESGHLTKFDGNNLDVSGVTKFDFMFAGNQLTDTSGVSDWKFTENNDISTVGMFMNNQINNLNGLKEWKTGKFTDINRMFAGNQISDLTPLADWDVSHITDMGIAFNRNSLINLNGLEKWTTTSLKILSETFDDNLINDISALKEWDTSNVTDLDATFYKNKISDLKPIAEWEVGKVTNFTNTFMNNKIKNLDPLKGWDTHSAQIMTQTFSMNEIENLKPLENWNTSSVKKMTGMFDTNSITDATPIANWDTSKAAFIDNMFFDNPINTAILANWNLDSIKQAGNFIKAPGKLVLVVNPKYDALMRSNSYYHNNQGPVSVVTWNDPNALTFKNGNQNDTASMPAIYSAESNDVARKAIIDNYIGPRRTEYENNHPGMVTTPRDDLDNLDWIDLVNAIFDVGPTPIPENRNNYYQFIDNDMNAKSPDISQHHEFQGKIGQTVDLNITIPENYELAHGQAVPPTEYTFKTNDNEPIIIHLVHKTNSIKEDKTIKRTITTIKPDGSFSDEVQSVTFTRTNTKDLVTQEITYGNWDKNSKTFPSRDVEQIAGYDSYVDNIKSKVVDSKTVAPTDSNITVTVTYKAQGGNPGTPDNPPDVPPEPETPPKKDEPKDEKPDTPPTPPEVPDDQTPDKVEEHKKTKKHVKTPGQNGPIKGERNGIVNHTQNGPVKGEQYTGPIKGQLKETSTKIAATKQSDELPQTGEKQTIAAAILGLALAGLGLLGISINKKNKDNSN